MKNHYIEKFKVTVSNFLKLARNIEQEKQNNLSRFQSVIADNENAKLQSQLNDEYIKAKSKINADFAYIREGLSMGKFPSVESLSADRMFFDGSIQIDISPKEVEVFIERYRHNFLMLDLISKWLDDKKFTTCKIQIHGADEYLKVYHQFATRALSLLGTIYNSPNNFNELELKAYGDSEFSKPLYGIIGDGAEISGYHTRQLPAGAEKLFDDISLNLDGDSQFQFNFKPIHR